MQGYENEKKVGSDIGMGTYEYREEREDEVRCHVRGGGRGEQCRVTRRTTKFAPT